ncbi:MAG: protein translocase subunit SecF [Gammaproteobacteria bacterium]|nr:protein translocase subunit SecF [Gammaproteobacteria bacterium]
MNTPNFDFMGKRKYAAIASAVLLVIALAELFMNGLNMGLDFTGGSLVELSFTEEVSSEEVRNFLADEGFANGTVQYFGSNREVLIRMPPQEGIEQSNLGDQIFTALKVKYGDIELRQSSYVGPAVGEELTEDGALALLTALIIVMLYILVRFTKQFSVGAVAALAHDVFIVLGCFAVFQWTFDLTVLAALLAVIGYSLNDTIVVSDRVRENFRKIRKATPIEVINKSLNQTLGRTLVTSLTTLFVLLALLFAGGDVIRGFALALSIGVVVGTYSSMYVAASILLLMNITREDLLVPEREETSEGTYP